MTHRADYTISLDSLNKWIDFTHSRAIRRSLENAIKGYVINHEDARESAAQFIRDAVFGAIRLPKNVSVLLSHPMLQRLRMHFDFSLASFTYPSVSTSLFSHTIGSQVVLAQILDRQARHAFPSGSQRNTPLESHHAPISDEQRELLEDALALTELAAVSYSDASYWLLGHDIKRGEESVFRIGDLSPSAFLAQSEQILGIVFERDPHTLPATMRRLVAASVFFCDQFFSFYSRVSRSRRISSTDTDALRVGAMILGLRLDSSGTVAQDIIYGPFGAKFLERLLRISDQSRIGIPLDLDRTVQGLELIVANATSPATHDPISGASMRIDALDPFIQTELTLSAQIIEERLASHPMIRFAHHTYQRYLTKVQRGPDQRIDFLSLLSQPDHAFISHRCRLVEARIFQNRLLYRVPQRRAFFLNEKVLVAPDWSWLYSGRTIRTEADRIQRALLVEACEAVRLLAFERVFERVIQDPQGLERYLRDELSKLGRSNKEIQAAQKRDGSISIVTVDDGPKLVPDYGDYLVRAGGIDRFEKLDFLTNARSSGSERSIYIYADEPLRPAIALLMERWIFREVLISGSLRSVLSSCPLSNERRDAISSLRVLGQEFGDLTVLHRPRIDLDRVAFFTGTPSDNQDKAYCGARNLMHKLGMYEGCCELVPPQRDGDPDLGKMSARFSAFGGQAGFRISEHLLRKFLNQFPSELRLAAAARVAQVLVIEKVHMDQLIDNLHQKRGPSDDAVAIIPLGRTSGPALLRGHEKQISKNWPNSECFVGLKQALNDKKIRSARQPLFIFVDDNIASGTQVINQCKYWFLPEYRDEARIMEPNISMDDLLPSEIELLRNSSLMFGFIVGRREGVERFRQFMKCEIANNPLVETLLRFEDLAMQPDESLDGFLAEVGRQTYSRKVLRDRLGAGEHSLDELTASEVTKINSRRLGFDDLRAGFVTSDNAPTSLYTAFWCPGVVSVGGVKSAWFPLFPRDGSFELMVIG